MSKPKKNGLTATQQTVFELLLEGQSNREIGEALERTEKAIKGHVTAILRHFDCDSRSRLIAQYYRGSL